MSRFRLLPLSFIALLLTVGLMAANQENVAAQGENLLANPSFEGAYSGFVPVTQEQNEACPHGVCTTAQMPAGWLPWWVPQQDTDEPWFNRMPEYKPVCPFDPCPFPERLKGGSQALQYFTFHSSHTAGVWQTVTVPANAVLKFSVWGQAWSSASDKTFSDFPSPVNMRIGIDPTGGNNPFSGSIVWSASTNPYDNYQLFEIEATAQGDKVTVFMWSQPTEARKHNDIYWDESSLVVVGQGAAVVSSGGGGGGGAVAAAPIQVGPTPTPNAQGEILVAVQPGDSIWGVAARSGITLDEILELNGLSRNDFVNAGDLLIVGYGENANVDPVDTTAEETTTTEETTTEEATTEEASTDDGTTEEAATDDTAVAEDGGETATEEEAAPEPTAVPEPTATPEPTGGTICLRAFDDTNQDASLGAGESLRTGVAIAVANGETIVSNYITNGAEPFCIEGLEAGAYRVTRSFTDNEVSTTAPDWAITLVDGGRIDIDFGSVIDTDASEEVAAVAEEASEETATDASTETETEAMADGAVEDAESGTNWINWVVGIIVGIALLLLVGVGLVVFSARRMS